LAAGWIVGHVWPDKPTQSRIRRQIEHGQKTIVVLDDKPPTVVVPRSSLPRVPTGAVEHSGISGDMRTLSIPPLNWLIPRDRERGEAFACRAARIVDASPQDRLPSSLVEGDLIGTGEPLRFVYCTRPIAIDSLRDVITYLFESEPVNSYVNARGAPPDHHFLAEWTAPRKVA
jgi:hypothetical protein